MCLCVYIHLLDIRVGYSKSQNFSFINLMFYLKNILLKFSLKKASSYSVFKSLFPSLFWKVWFSFHVDTITIPYFWELPRFFWTKTNFKMCHFNRTEAPDWSVFFRTVSLILCSRWLLAVFAFTFMLFCSEA